MDAAFGRIALWPKVVRGVKDPVISLDGFDPIPRRREGDMEAAFRCLGDAVSLRAQPLNRGDDAHQSRASVSDFR